MSANHIQQILELYTAVKVLLHVKLTETEPLDPQFHDLYNINVVV